MRCRGSPGSGFAHCQLPVVECLPCDFSLELGWKRYISIDLKHIFSTFVSLHKTCSLRMCSVVENNGLWSSDKFEMELNLICEIISFC